MFDGAKRRENRILAICLLILVFCVSLGQQRAELRDLARADLLSTGAESFGGLHGQDITDSIGFSSCDAQVRKSTGQSEELPSLQTSGQRLSVLRVSGIGHFLSGGADAKARLLRGHFYYLNACVLGLSRTFFTSNRLILEFIHFKKGERQTALSDF